MCTARINAKPGYLATYLKYYRICPTARSHVYRESAFVTGVSFLALLQCGTDLAHGYKIGCKLIMVRRKHLLIGREHFALERFRFVISTLANIEGCKVMLGTSGVWMDVAETGDADGKAALEQRFGFRR